MSIVNLSIIFPASNLYRKINKKLFSTHIHIFDPVILQHYLYQIQFPWLELVFWILWNRYSTAEYFRISIFGICQNSLSIVRNILKWRSQKPLAGLQKLVIFSCPFWIDTLFTIYCSYFVIIFFTREPTIWMIQQKKSNYFRFIQSPIRK